MLMAIPSAKITDLVLKEKLSETLKRCCFSRLALEECFWIISLIHTFFSLSFIACVGEWEKGVRHTD